MATHSPLCTLHHRRAPSLPPLITTSSPCPPAPQATAKSIPGWPAKVRMRDPRSVSHTNNSPPSLPLPEASIRPLGLHSTSWTWPRCPVICWSSLPSLASHTYTVPSSPPPARYAPSGLHGILVELSEVRNGCVGQGQRKPGCGAVPAVTFFSLVLSGAPSLKEALASLMSHTNTP